MDPALGEIARVRVVPVSARRDYDSTERLIDGISGRCTHRPRVERVQCVCRVLCVRARVRVRERERQVRVQV